MQAVQKSCDECGREFPVDTSKRNWQRVKFCSDACRTERTRRNVRAQYTKQEWPQQRTCEWCGGDFLVHGPGGQPRRYCGRECYLAKRQDDQRRKFEANRKPKVCAHCGEAFLPRKHGAGKQIYCGEKCGAAASFAKHGAKHQRAWSSVRIFRAVKPAILDRDGHKCVLCGSPDRLHIHHLDGNGRVEAADHRPENLMTLCKDCHQDIHRVNLVKIDGAWMVQGKIFERLGLTGALPIHSG